MGSLMEMMDLVIIQELNIIIALKAKRRLTIFGKKFSVFIGKLFTLLKQNIPFKKN